MWILVNPWIFLVLLLDIRSTICEGVDILVVQEEELNLMDAIKVCQGKGGRLPSGTKRDHALLTIAAKRNNLVHAWVNVKAKRSEYLTWLDGAAVNDRLFDQHDANCGVIHTYDENLFEYYCDNYYPSLCQLPSNEFTSCPPNLECFIFHQSYYFVNIDYLNWYEAYSYCTSVGWNLAVLKSDKITLLSRAIRTVTGRKLSTPDLWVGSRTVDWFDTGTLDRVERYHWLEGQPNVQKDCVVLTSEESQVGWKSILCSEKANFACIFLQDTQKGKKFTISAEEETQYPTVHDDHTIQGEDQTNRKRINENDSNKAVNWDVTSIIVSTAPAIAGVAVCCLFTIIGYCNKRAEEHPG